MSVHSNTHSYSFYDVFLVGEAYRNGAEILLGCLGQEVSQDFKYVIAANHALALELYFKCLLLMESVQPQHHHELDTHFSRLSTSTQDEIRKKYEVIMKTDPAWQAECAKTRKTGEDLNQILVFENALRASAKAFEQSRYPYDPKYKAHAYFGFPIAQAARMVIIDRHPAWDQAFWSLQSRPNTPPTSQVR